jgi:hypothetical protein
MLAIVAPADDIDDATQPWLLACRILIVTDEQPFVYDASSYEVGIISVRLFANRDPKHVTRSSPTRWCNATPGTNAMGSCCC